MGGSEATTAPSSKPLTGTAQGAVQAVLVTLLVLDGSAPPPYPDAGWSGRGIVFWTALLALVGVLIGCGIAVDRRRIGRPLSLVAPVGVRRVLLAVVVGVVLLPCAALWAVGYGGLASDLLRAFVCTFLGWLVVLVPYAFVALDRVVGPAWVLVGSLLRAAARRRWARHEVVEIDGARALVADERGDRFYVRSEGSLEPGVVFLRLKALAGPVEPYRNAGVRATVEACETLDERRERARGIATAALALISGLAWAILPFASVLGRALVGR